MRYIFITTCTLICLFASVVCAEMYIWTDEKGVKHFGNSAPPPGAKDTQVRDEIQKTPEQRAAEQAYNRERRRKIRAYRAAKKAEEERHRQQKFQRERDAISRINASKKARRSVAKKPKSDYVKNLENKANQWYPGKDKSTANWSHERRMDALHDPRRLEAQRAQRQLIEVYGGSAIRQTESFEKEEDKYWEKGKTEEQDPKPWHDTEGTLYTPASGGYINTKTGDFCTQAGSNGVINTRTGNFTLNPTGFDD